MNEKEEEIKKFNEWFNNKRKEFPNDIAYAISLQSNYKQCWHEAFVAGREDISEKVLKAIENNKDVELDMGIRLKEREAQARQETAQEIFKELSDCISENDDIYDLEGHVIASIDTIDLNKLQALITKFTLDKKG
jgi:DNA-binding transcriptional regulator GbsR (MarR family)